MAASLNRLTSAKYLFSNLIQHLDNELDIPEHRKEMFREDLFKICLQEQSVLDMHAYVQLRTEYIIRGEGWNCKDILKARIGLHFYKCAL